jgi:hypothetical protein
MFMLYAVFFLYFFFHHAEGPERVLGASPQIGSYLILSCEWQIFFVISAVFKGTHCKSTVPKTRKNIPRDETARPPS